MPYILLKYTLIISVFLNSVFIYFLATNNYRWWFFESLGFSLILRVTYEFLQLKKPTKKETTMHDFKNGKFIWSIGALPVIGQIFVTYLIWKEY